MTFFEAQRSGRRFKRPGMREWIPANFSFRIVTESWITATDWQVEQDELAPFEEQAKAIILALGLRLPTRETASSE